MTVPEKQALRDEKLGRKSVRKVLVFHHALMNGLKGEPELRRKVRESRPVISIFRKYKKMTLMRNFFGKVRMKMKIDKFRGSSFAVLEMKQSIREFLEADINSTLAPGKRTQSHAE